MARQFARARAWFFMTETEKRALRMMRFAGRTEFGGGKPYLPKYWHIQEAGSPITGVAGKHYIQSAISDMRGQFDGIVGRLLDV